MKINKLYEIIKLSLNQKKVELKMNNTKKVFEVIEFESESGWGGKNIDKYYFPDEESAKQFMSEYHRKNNSETIVPDYYISHFSNGYVYVNKEMFEKFKFDSNKFNGIEMKLNNFEFDLI